MKPNNLNQTIKLAKQDRVSGQRELGIQLANKKPEELLDVPPETWSRLGEDGLRAFLGNFDNGRLNPPRMETTGKRPTSSRARWRTRHARAFIKIHEAIGWSPYPIRGLTCGLTISLLAMLAGLAVASGGLAANTSPRVDSGITGPVYPDSDQPQQYPQTDTARQKDQ
jgi:hypothetical protein